MIDELPTKIPFSAADIRNALRQDLSGVSETPDERTRREEHDGLIQATLAAAQARLESYKQDTAERKKYAELFFGLTLGWLLFLAGVSILQGFAAIWRVGTFKLSENVLLALIGSCTANILGILYLVANYLFPKKPMNDDFNPSS